MSKLQQQQRTLERTRAHNDSLALRVVELGKVVRDRQADLVKVKHLHKEGTKAVQLLLVQSHTYFYTCMCDNMS